MPDNSQGAIQPASSATLLSLRGKRYADCRHGLLPRAHARPRRMAGDVSGFFATARRATRGVDSALGTGPHRVDQVEHALFLRAQTGVRIERLPKASWNHFLSGHGIAGPKKAVQRR